MSVVRRCSAGAVVAALVLLGGPAWAQEDPCAPGADGSVPEMCQSGPGSTTPTVGVDPADPCAGARPVEPGDGVVSEGDQGIAEGEPHPDAPPSDVQEDPAPEGEPKDEQVDPATTEDTSPQPDAPPPGADGDDGVVCAFVVPVAAPAESAAGGGVTAAPRTATSFGAGQAAGQLPRTGAYDRLLALASLGAALVIVGAGAAAAGRRRSTQV